MFGIYIHIPFCIQRCHYCDFATYAKDQIAPNTDYVDHLIQEARMRRSLIPYKKVDSVYFGGGTPSLLPAEEIGRILSALQDLDFEFTNNCEITLEVNPATLDSQKSKLLKSFGVNRLSVGSQTFDDELLKACNREHNSEQTLQTLSLIADDFDNYSLDLLFSLPKQNMPGLAKDLEVVKKVSPPHVSAYCLTLPNKHPMNEGRCSEEEQIEMFDVIKMELKSLGLDRYEISNFSRPGRASVHNSIYWTDHSYWGLGLSAHSYLNKPDWGHRFWNPSSYETYLSMVKALKDASSIVESYPKGSWEKLSREASLTDFCHTHLRLQSGLQRNSLRQKFGATDGEEVERRARDLEQEGLLIDSGQGWSLTERGVLLSNRVFAKLLFSSDAIDRG